MEADWRPVNDSYLLETSASSGHSLSPLCTKYHDPNHCNPSSIWRVFFPDAPQKADCYRQVCSAPMNQVSKGKVIAYNEAIKDFNEKHLSDPRALEFRQLNQFI
jgi:hypothetical protein